MPISTELIETAVEAESNRLNFPFVMPITADQNLYFDPDLRTPLLDAIGGKALGLCRLKSIGLNVPEGFFLTIDAHRALVDRDRQSGVDATIGSLISQELHALEARTEKSFGEDLIVSVRSGAKISMPGMMATYTNVGITDKNLPILIEQIGEVPALESYLSLILNFGRNIYGIDSLHFSEIPIHAHYAEDLRIAIADAQRIILEQTSKNFPQDPYVQLVTAIQAVHASWDHPKTIEERMRKNLGNGGTAVIVMEMIFGNSNVEEGNGSGVLITKNPKTLGEAVVDFRPGHQGTHVVSDVASDVKTTLSEIQGSLREVLREHIHTINIHFQDPQDVEFTVIMDHVQPKVYFLQTRNAPLSHLALFRLAVERMKGGLLTPNEAIRTMSLKTTEALLAHDLDQNIVAQAKKAGRLIAQGSDIAHGAAIGQIVYSIEEARTHPKQKVILACNVTEDILWHLPHNINGIIASNGSLGSHLARHAEALGAARLIPIVFGVTIDRSKIEQYSMITLDGTNGQVFMGEIPFSVKSGHRLLTKWELATIRAYAHAFKSNPWYFAANEYSDSPDIYYLAGPALKMVKTFTGHKAREYAALKMICASLPLQPYEIYSIRDIPYTQMYYELRKKILSILVSGSHATVRTSHDPPQEGGGPYAVIRDEADMENYLTKETFGRFGGLTVFLRDYDLRELLIGKIPKGKLDHDLARQHCSFSLRILRSGKVALQIHPFSPLLRAHDKADRDDMITITYDPTISYLTPEERWTIAIGENLRKKENRTEAFRFLNYVNKTVFGDWVRNHQLFERMATIGMVLPADQYNTPVLNGQARIFPNGTPDWIRPYDLNCDKKDRSLKHRIAVGAVRAKKQLDTALFGIKFLLFQ